MRGADRGRRSAPSSTASRARRVPRRHAAPARARRRPAARRGDRAARARSRRRMPVVFPVHPADAGRARARSASNSGCDRLRAARPGRLRRVPEPRRRLGGRAHRLGRHPGGDDVPRRALLHAAGEHRAADHGHDGHEHAPGPRSGANRRGAGTAGRGASKETQIPPLWDGKASERIVDVLAQTLGGEPVEQLGQTLR